MTGAALIERAEFVADVREAVAADCRFAVVTLVFDGWRKLIKKDAWIDPPPTQPRPGKTVLRDDGADL